MTRAELEVRVLVLGLLLERNVGAHVPKWIVERVLEARISLTHYLAIAIEFRLLRSASLLTVRLFLINLYTSSASQDLCVVLLLVVV